MMLPFDVRKNQWNNGKLFVKFNPCGKFKRHGKRINPLEWESDTTYAARIFIGRKIGNTVAITEKQIIDYIKKIRTAQSGKADSSYLTQKGIYTMDSGETVREPSLQVVIFYDRYTKEKSVTEWKRNIRDLTNRMAIHFRQELIILEFQKNGIVQKVYGFSQKGQI